jgi:hypothetical protein
MSKGLSIWMILATFGGGLQAQGLVPADTIAIENGLFKHFHIYNQRIRTAREINVHLNRLDDPLTQQLLRKAQSWHYAGQASGIAGGFLMGYALSQKEQNQEPMPSLFLYGLGLAIGSFLLQNQANRKFFDAVSRYNYVVLRPYVDSSPTPIPQRQTGLGLSIRF